MKIDERTIERLAEAVDGFKNLLQSREYDARMHENDQSEIRRLRKENYDLKLRINSTEHKASEERARQLDIQQTALDADKKLEYNKGYAAAYTEVTSKMGSRS